MRFILHRDPNGRFLFAPLQSEAGQELLVRFGLSSTDTTTIVLIEDGRSWTKSAAALRIARRMAGLWPVFYVFKVFPAAWRDCVYDFVARHRYEWFGRFDQCLIPTPEERARFLESLEDSAAKRPT